MTGPVEYLVVGFPDGTVSDDLALELAKLVNNEVINILDVVVLTKDTTGEVTVAEFDELDQFASFAEVDAEVGGLISAEDIDFVGDDLDPGSAAAVLLVEDLWAASLADALACADVTSPARPSRRPSSPRPPGTSPTGWKGARASASRPRRLAPAGLDDPDRCDRHPQARDVGARKEKSNHDRFTQLQRSRLGER